MQILYRVGECVLRCTEEGEDRYLEGIDDRDHQNAGEEGHRDARAYRLMCVFGVILALADVEICRTSVTEAPCECLREDEDREDYARCRVTECAQPTVAYEYLVYYVVERAYKQRHDAR